MSNRSLKRSLRKSQHKEEAPQEDLMERFHEEKVCNIPATSSEKKPDVFAMYRPKSAREFKNYNISQTDTKMDAGPTKIHVQQTRAVYEPYPEGHVFAEDIPPPPPKKRKKPSHSRGPVWLFMDEELKRKVDAEQVIYKKEMIARIKRKAHIAKMKKENDHNEIMRTTGPDWYQELSPSQLRAVDKLENCLSKDTMRDTIDNTKECLAELGLVLRPNSRNIALALEHSCLDPVEFLLILYQLTNPKRTSYSLNDRLLLSAVVHLSMTSFLRELHIRIPSPPSCPEVKPEKKKPKRKYAKYKSPYLVPFTFEPEPPKHTGIYKNCHVQYPESPYFSYMDELREEIKQAQPRSGELEETSFAQSVTSMLENEISEEFIAAQHKYDNLPCSTKKAKLLRPSIYKQCKLALMLFGLKTVDKISKQNSGSCGGDIMVSGKLNIDLHNENVHKTGSKNEYLINIQEESKVEYLFIIVGIAIGKDGEAIPIIGGVVPKRSTDCVCTAKGIKNIEENESEEKNKKKEEKEKQEKLQCQKEECTCETCTLGETSSSTSVSTLGSFVKKPIEEPDLKEKLLQVKRPKPDFCDCRDMAEIIIECSEKKVECVENCGKKNPTFIVADTKLDEEEQPMSIIAGVKGEKKCTCLEKYRRTINKYEELKSRIEAEDTLKSCGQKFFISGVTTGPDGKPIYILSGLSSERPCKKCEEMKELQKQEDDRLANIPDNSQLHQKYIISGVYNSPAGNMFVLSGVAPTKDCECMKLYNAFVDKHAFCMDLYEKYMRKVKKDTDEYMAEIAADGRYTPVEEVKSETKCPELEENVESDFQTSTPDIDFSACALCCEAKNDSQEEVTEDIKEMDSYEDQEIEGSVQVRSKGSKKPPIPNVPLGRFIVLDKIPCDYSSQIAILKKAVCAMARDGFPLANLPHSYKLPHLRLWMARRCGKSWTMEDRDHLHILSKYYWHHIDNCTAQVKSPRLAMSNKRAWKYTWASAKFVKKITGELIERHCREAKQNTVEEGREFFPSMFHYQLPTNTFRDCYFAYLPTKEEAVFANRPWKVFEYTDYKLIRIKMAKKCQIMM